MGKVIPFGKQVMKVAEDSIVTQKQAWHEAKQHVTENAHKLQDKAGDKWQALKGGLHGGRRNKF